MLAGVGVCAGSKRSAWMDEAWRRSIADNLSMPRARRAVGAFELAKLRVQGFGGVELAAGAALNDEWVERVRALIAEALRLGMFVSLPAWQEWGGAFTIGSSEMRGPFQYEGPVPAGAGELVAVAGEGLDARTCEDLTDEFVGEAGRWRMEEGRWRLTAVRARPGLDPHEVTRRYLRAYGPALSATVDSIYAEAPRLDAAPECVRARLAAAAERRWVAPFLQACREVKVRGRVWRGGREGASALVGTGGKGAVDELLLAGATRIYAAGELGVPAAYVARSAALLRRAARSELVEEAGLAMRRCTMDDGAEVTLVVNRRGGEFNGALPFSAAGLELWDAMSGRVRRMRGGRVRLKPHASILVVRREGSR